jgi:predicted polyphosphate/ATP-dependent NAD kinase
LGIPCGVKMHSGVFGVNPRAAGAMMADLVANPKRVDFVEDAEVMDIDEDALRNGVLAPRLYGLARVPISRSLMQAAKGGPRLNSAGALSSAAAEIVAEMDVETLYIIGPGTSAQSVAKAAGQTASTLGVDAMIGRKIVAHDVDDASLLRLAKGRKLRIVLGVTGQQGFLLGRGNQQIGAKLVRRAGREGLMILATEEKLTQLSQPRLLVDTGEPDLDLQLAGFVRVTTGKRRKMMMRIDSC